MKFLFTIGVLFISISTFAQQITTTTPSLTISGDSTGVNTNNNLLPPELQSIQGQLRTDSLSQKDAERLLDQAEGQIPPEYQSWLDSLKSAYNIRIDSTTTDKAIEAGTEVGVNKLKQIDEVEEHAEIISQVETEIGPIHEVPKKFGSLKDTLSNPENLEQMLTNHAQGMEELQELSTQQATFDELQSQFDPERMAKEQEKFLKQQEKYAQQLDQFQDGDFQQKKLEEESLKRVMKTTNKLAKHSKQVEKAQTKLASLKKKYSYVPNSNDLSTAVKRNSLEGKPIKDRLVLGVTFQIQIAEKSNVDISPLLGYKLNKKWWAGAGFTYRATFGSDIKLSDAFDDQVYGWRVFSEYTAWKTFFTHAEWERMSGIVTDQATQEPIGRQWSDGLLVGVGKNYNFVKKVKGNVMVLYDFLHDENSVYPKAWVVRFGFFLEGLPKVGRSRTGINGPG